MKYGDTLRQRSIPAWSSHNIDYDEIKYFIKERTTPGKGKSIAIPGHSDDKLFEFENALYHILEDQHARIDLFVASKAGEIRRRLDHAKKQLKRLSTQNASTTGPGIPIERLERYSRLESDVLKAGDEIRSLARFTSTQRTAFRKLLKKYKKWTGSPELEARFRQDVLDSPKSFTNLDLGPLLDDYSDTLQDIRNLYESRLKQATSGNPKSAEPAKVETSTDKLLAATQERSKVDLDTAVGTMPFGENGSMANYFIHVDNVVELQILLLRHLEYYTPRSRTSSLTQPLSRSESRNEPSAQDYFTLIADDLDRFAREQSAVTIDEREHLSGRTPQRAKVIIRWNNDEDAIVSARAGSSKTKSVPIKKKNVDAFFDPSAPLSVKKDVRFENSDQQASPKLREDLLRDRTIRPLFKICSCRSRFVGLNNGPKGVVLATLDSNIIMQKAAASNGQDSKSEFPFAVLQVRQEDAVGAELLAALDNSHLVERVRGFSLQYHALWQLYEPDNFAPPFWLPILSRDIRKLPPPMLRASGSVAAGSSGSQSATQRSSSIADGSTAVETTGQSSSPAPDQLEIPPLRSFRKKRRRTYAESIPSTVPQERYWSEYDHPEDGSQNGDAYVIYVDPNEKSPMDIFFSKVGSLFTFPRPLSAKKEEEEALLPPTSATLEDDEASSDEDTGHGKLPSYGSITRHFTSPTARQEHGTSAEPPRFLPRVTVACLAASVAILVVAYILATTSKHKYATEVDAGVLFAVACSLIFAIVGFVPMLTRRDGNRFSLSLAVVILVLDAVCCGGLLAWMLG